VAGIGILGGSFNPPHVGHLELARAAREQLALERVLLMPLNAPAHKPLSEDPGPARRLEMCRLAVAAEPGLGACAMEIERGGVSYTADTLQELHVRHPEAELTFVVGADTATTLPSWHEPWRILRLARLAVADRPGSDRALVRDALAAVVAPDGEPVPVRARFLAMIPTDASSTRARELLAAGLPVEGLVPAAVARYALEHGLYAPRRETPSPVPGAAARGAGG
jgi:nicotinate-nucleotide adenylyltransferase